LRRPLDRAIPRAFADRFKNSRKKEIETALTKIYNIIELRLRALIQ
jgi:2-oxo-4-hydroxy-4-carboxy--5-ureidoimidazoline (OHCU) decarboxylase